MTNSKPRELKCELCSQAVEIGGQSDFIGDKKAVTTYYIGIEGEKYKSLCEELAEALEEACEMMGLKLTVYEEFFPALKDYKENKS